MPAFGVLGMKMLDLCISIISTQELIPFFSFHNSNFIILLQNYPELETNLHNQPLKPEQQKKKCQHLISFNVLVLTLPGILIIYQSDYKLT